MLLTLLQSAASGALSGSASVTQTATPAASAAPTFSATASLTSTFTPAASASSTRPATASLTSTFTPAATGTPTLVGSATLTTTPTPTAAGTLVISATASLTTTFTPAATGSSPGGTQTATASLTSTFTPAATGTLLLPRNPTATTVTITATPSAQAGVKKASLYKFTGSTHGLQPRIWGSGRFQYSLIKKGTTITESSYPTAADQATADFIYYGGYVYEISEPDAEILAAAGYASTPLVGTYTWGAIPTYSIPSTW